MVELPTITKLDDLVERVRSERGLHVRWSRGPERDLEGLGSMPEVSGIAVTADPLDAPSDWLGSPRDWITSVLVRYLGPREASGDQLHAWVLRGTALRREEDGSVLIGDPEPIAWIDDVVLDAAERDVAGAP